ncbi:MAG: 3'-5' exonuclease [Anaerolineae bacterium]|nr:3'-5' exonuclease [Anaerolineae bacterium]
MARHHLASIIPAPAPARLVVEQTPGGILLPPGVAAKLNAKSALAAAEALVAGLPVASPQGAEAAVLAAVHQLESRLAQTQAALTKAERRLRQLEQPNPAAQLLAQNPLFIDLETAGLKKTDPVLEVAVIDTQGHVLLSTLVNAGQQPIPPQATAVNGITNAMVVDAPAWADVAPLLQPLLAGRTVVAHNAKFEAKFLPPWDIAWVCSKKLADTMLGQRHGWGGLQARLAQCQLEPGPAHSAAGDCLSTLRLIRHLAGLAEPVALIY